MEVILKEDIEKLGKAGEVIKVKPGFARNYLLPRKLALESTQSNLKLIEVQKKIIQKRVSDELKDAEALKAKLSSLSCSISVKVGDDDKAFGSVTSADIARVLDGEGVKIDKRKIELDEPIKALGVYTVSVKLHKDVTAPLKVWVVKT